LAVDIAANCSKATLTWDAPPDSGGVEITYKYHDGSWENGHVYYFGYDGWMGCYFPDATSGEIQKIRIMGIDNNTSSPANVTVDIFDNNQNLIGTSESLSFQYSSTGVWNEFVFTDIVEYDGPFYAMMHMNNPGTAPQHSGFIACDTNGPHINEHLSWWIDPNNGWQEPNPNNDGSPHPDVMFIEANVLSAGKSMTLGYHSEINTPTEASRATFAYNVYRDGVKLTATPIEATTYEDTFAMVEGQEYEWAVAVVCTGGLDSEWETVTDKCGDVPPPPCDPVTGAEATVGCTTATITWTAVEGATGYKISRDGAVLGTVTETTYTETGEFEDGETYTWNIVTVCGSDEATAATASATADCKGIGELANSVSIYPNPANNEVKINAKDYAKVEIYNTVGQLIETKTSTTVDVSNYNTGIYFFKVYDIHNNSVTKRIMIAR
jgi:hypothetical protein